MTVVDSPTATINLTDHWTGAAANAPWLERARDVVPALAACAAVHDHDGTFVAESMSLLRDQGFLSMLVPADLGGGGATHAEACAVLAELARGCPATSLTLSMHTHLIAAQVWRHHRSMPAPVLARVAADNLCLVSTGASDWLESSGTAVQVDGGYRVSGRKMPSSGCPAGDILVTSVRWSDAPDGPQVIHCTVPFSAGGVSIDETWDTLGMRGTGSHTVVLDDVFVPEAAISLVRPAGEWHPVWAIVAGAALPLVMASYVGVAEAAAELALGARPRVGRADVVTTVGRIHTHLTAAQDAVAAMIRSSDDLHFDNTMEHADVTFRRKSIATRACIDAVSVALDLGGAAFARDAGIERLFRDVQGARYHPMPLAQQEAFTGAHMLA